MKIYGEYKNIKATIEYNIRKYKKIYEQYKKIYDILGNI